MLVLVCAIDPDEAERDEEEEETGEEDGGDEDLIVLTAVFADKADLEQALPKVLDDSVDFTINGKTVAFNANKHKCELELLDEPFLDPMVGSKPDKEYEVIVRFPDEEDPGYTGYYVLEYNPRH